MWMLHFVQHDKSGVIPSACEESSAMWMLHFVQHDKSGVIPSASEESIVDASLRYAPFSMTKRCHSERSFLSFRAHARNPVRCGCFASLSMTSNVIPSVARNPVCGSLEM